MTSEVIDAEVRDVTVAQQTVPTLFGTSNPREHIERAQEAAKALKDVLDQRGLIANIQNKEYVLYDGWTLLGSMVGVSPVNTWTKKIEGGWEARVEVRRGDQVIGAAEAECLRDERRWATADDYAIKSMAQTRAGAKALRTCLGFIVQLAGYEATPFDEMPTENLIQDAQQRLGAGTKVRAPKCKTHGDMRFVKAGTSKAGKAYSSFWGCTNRECKTTVDHGDWMTHLETENAPAEKVDYDDVPFNE